MGFKMKHLGNSPLSYHKEGHYSDWKDEGESRTTTTKGTQRGRTGTFTTTEQDQSRKKYFSKDLVEKQKQQQWIKDNPEKYKEKINKRNKRTLTNTSFRPDLETSISISKRGMKPLTTTIKADANARLTSRPPSPEPTKGTIDPKDGTPRKKRNMPDLTPNLRPVGDAIGAFGSAVGRGAENVVNSIFGPRSIFRICRGCK